MTKPAYTAEDWGEEHGFSFRSVCWGYREIFIGIVDGLLSDGLIGEDKDAVTQEFFSLLKSADQSCFDHVLKVFLGAVNSRTRWIFDLPGIFTDVVNLGRELAESKLYYGIAYFQALGEGGLGRSPEEVRNLVNHVKRIRAVDEELAFAFVKGYGKLLDRLAPTEITTYINEGVRLFHGNRSAAAGFMEGTARSSENIIRSITRECRLDDVRGSLAILLKALVGREVEVSDLGALDSDDLIERGSMVVCMHRWLYVPVSIRHFDTEAENRSWYYLLTVVAAAMLAENSFAAVHGHPDFSTAADLVGQSIFSTNLLQIVEYTRVLKRARERWPGCRKLLDLGLRTEFSRRGLDRGVDCLLHACLCPGDRPSPHARIILGACERSVNIFETASLLGEHEVELVGRTCAGLGEHELMPLCFVPDMMFPGHVSNPPSDRLVVDLKEQAERRREEGSGGRGEEETGTASGDDASDEGEGEEDAVAAAFVYDEWCDPDNDYHINHCLLREKECSDRISAEMPGDVTRETRYVREMFERLKPDEARKEKWLADGDYINPDVLVDYIVRRNVEPLPRIEFYEKPLIRRRDLAVLVLLDVSGSTGEKPGGEKVLDIEKSAALIFGEGLDSLGDRFSVCGFSGNGRENCEYFVYKDFGDPWGIPSMRRILGAYPSSSTRIGVALRHSGHRMAGIDSKQRLIILITDGKPMDAGYDPTTRYAQYDVRNACEENAKIGIDTFAISTEENTRADMEIMFPRRRFVILDDIRKLPNVLPQLYLRMTA